MARASRFSSRLNCGVGRQDHAPACRHHRTVARPRSAAPAQRRRSPPAFAASGPAADRAPPAARRALACRWSSGALSIGQHVAQLGQRRRIAERHGQRRGLRADFGIGAVRPALANAAAQALRHGHLPPALQPLADRSQRSPIARRRCVGLPSRAVTTVERRGRADLGDRGGP